MPSGSGDQRIMGRSTYRLTVNGVTIDSSNIDEEHGHTFWERTSNSTPGYFTILASGSILPINQFGFKRSFYTYLFGSKTRVFDNHYGYRSVSERTGRIGNAPLSYKTFLYSEVLALQQQAILKLRLKIKDQKVNFSQAFAEREQTIRMFKDNIERMGKAYHALRKGDFVSAAKALGVGPGNRGKVFTKNYLNNQTRAISQGWLELQYGWRPLISDIYGSIQILDDWWNNKIPMIKAETKLSRLMENVYQSTGPQGETITEIHKRRLDVKVYCVFSPSRQFVKNLAESGITNPALLAWELTPFSFVVDWLLPVGNWLSSLDATLGVDFKSGGITTFQEEGATQMRYNSGHGDGDTTYFEDSSLAAGRVVNTRSVFTSFPLAIYPVAKDPFSDEHIANALALLKSNFRK